MIHYPYLFLLFTSNTLCNKGLYNISFSSLDAILFITSYPPNYFIVVFLDLFKIIGVISSQSSSKSLNKMGSLVTLLTAWMAFSLNFIKTFSEIILLFLWIDSISLFVIDFTLSLKK